DANEFDLRADALRRLIRRSIGRPRGDERFAGGAERTRAPLENRTRSRADDHVVAADVVDAGDDVHEVAGVIRWIAASHARRDPAVQRVDRLSPRAPPVFVRADPDEALVVGRLKTARLEGHRLPAAADDGRGGQQADAAQAEIPDEAAA